MIELDAALDANRAIVPLIYEAAVATERWPDALASAIEFSGSELGMVTVSYRASRRGEIFTHVGLSQEFVETWEAKYGYNEWVDLAAALPAGEVIHAAETVPVEQMLETPMGEELIAPLAVVDGAGLRMSDSPLLVAALSVYAKQHYAPQSLDRLRFLAPHLARGLALHQRIRTLEARSSAFAAGIDELAAGIVLLDRNARCLHANAAARGLLDEGDGIALEDGSVALRGAGERRALAEAIDQALTAAPSGASRGLFRIRRPSGRRAYHAVVSPVVSALMDPGSSPAVLLWLTDPDSQLTPSEQSLGKLLDLTPAEARVAAAIAGGRSISDHARQAGITIGTARWTLKQVLAKTAVSSQSELVRLILSSVPSPPF